MFEEPFRYVEAIANRREYIENELAAGSPVVAMSLAEGILFFTLSRDRQKLFEIHDRIGLGAVGHPGDIERLRMLAIELAGAEGFTRSDADVSLRRLANYSLSPALKAAFEQIYGAPFLARLLFAELGREPAADAFLRLDYDGAIRSNGNPALPSRPGFGAVSGSVASEARMERLLAARHRPDLGRDDALRLARDAWMTGTIPPREGDAADENLPTETIRARQDEALREAVFEAALLERAAPTPAQAWRMLGTEELRGVLAAEPTKAP